MLADRVQQGMLNFLFLGRAMLATGFASDPAFQRADGTARHRRRPRCSTTATARAGSSAGRSTAWRPTSTRAVLGVPGMNYSTLLTRSVDFDS